MREGVLLLCLGICVGVNAQKKELEATRINEAIVIDGILDEGPWLRAARGTDFITISPKFNETPNQKTEFQILYNNTGIYVGIRCFDSSPDSIHAQLATRDASNIHAEYAYIHFDTYGDKQNALFFGVTASGVQIDGKQTLGSKDHSWDAVWESSVKINADGWFAEMKIPFSALRFPDKEVQTWNIQVIRKLRRIREESSWTPQSQLESNPVAVFGKLNNLSGIEPPLRLSFNPYLSGYIEQDQEGHNTSFLRGGMDLKYGINESFTIDLTLIPDFGEVQSDNQVLNLSPFEIQYQERRPFFTEGTDIFNKGGIFYSRRVGGRPHNYSDVENNLGEGEEIISNPAQNQLINAIKLTGRTKKNLGVGFFNAISGRTFATIGTESMEEYKARTQGLTNYNVFVLDQNLINNSNINITNTSVIREGNERDANVTSLKGDFRDEKNMYSARGNFAYSQITGDALNGEIESGYKYFLTLAKISGNFRFSVTEFVESDTWDPNDLGINFQPNDFNHNANISYESFKPNRHFLKYSFSLGSEYKQLFKPRSYANFTIYGSMFGVLKSYTALGGNIFIQPQSGFDFYESRLEGRYVRLPNLYDMSGWFSSDYRKAFALDGGFGYFIRPEYESNGLNFNLKPIIRVSDKFNFSFKGSWDRSFNERGFASIVEDTISVFGRRDRNTVVFEFTGSYIFTNKMGLSLRARHYWANVQYDQLYDLRQSGELKAVTRNINPNTNFNAFNIDMVYTWEFAPGSQLSLSWKNLGLLSNEDEQISYLHNFEGVLAENQANSLSLKLLYYLDYLNLKNRFTRKIH